MRLVFMGTAEFALPILENLRRSKHQIAAVYTQPDKPTGRGQKILPSLVKRAAQDLPVFQPSSLKKSEEAVRFAEYHPDIVIVAAFGQLLPDEILKIPPFGCLNIHPSLLPQHRGPSPIAAAILAGDEITGTTLMLMDEGMDTGPILAQEKIPILPQDTTISLTVKLAQLGAQLLNQTLPLWVEGKITPQPQDEAKATYSQLITKEVGEIDWHLAAIEIWRRVRAFQPWPSGYTTWQGKLLKIIQASPLPEQNASQPGRVIALKPKGIGVETGQGVLQIIQVQLEGKKVMPAEQFALGQRGFIGSFFPKKVSKETLNNQDSDQC